MTSGTVGDGARPGIVALGIDIGSSNIKASLVSLNGTVTELAVCTAPTPPDADDLVRVASDAVRSTLVSAGDLPIAVGIASMAESGVPLGDDDEPLRPIVRWDGNDDVSDLESLLGRLGPDDLYASTGVPALPKAPLVLWARLRRTDPALWSAMHRWAGVADLVGLALTGELATDHTLAARTMAFRTTAAELPTAFDERLLEAVGLSPAHLPEVRRPGDPVGAVTAAAAARTGLAEGTPVFIAGHDHAVGAWAAGARNAGDVADSIGTAEALIRVLGEFPAADRVRPTGMSITRTVTGEPSLLAGSAGSGAFVRWWFAHRIGARAAGDVLTAVAEIGTQPSEYTVLPYLSGRQSPLPDLRAGVRVLDQNGDEVDAKGIDSAVLAHAMFDGLALHARWMLEEQERMVGPSARPVRILGGPGGSNRAWMQQKAQTFPIPSRLTSVSEPVATGAAMLAAVRAGAFPGGAPTLPDTDLPRSPGDTHGEAFLRFVTAATGASAGARGDT